MNSREVFDRYKRRTNKKGLNSKQEKIEQMKNNYEYYLDEAVNSLEYEDYYNPNINGKLVLLEESDGSGSTDIKSITTPIDSQLKVGDSIKIKANHLKTQCWLLYKEEQLAVNSHRKFIIYSCNQTINFKGLPQPMWCVADDTAYFTKGSVQGDYFIENDAKLKIYLPRNEYTEKIYVGMRFIFEHKTCYEVTQEAIVVLKELVSLTLARSTTQAEDDLVNNIAFNPELDKVTPNPTPSFTEIHGESEIRLGQEYKFFIDGATEWSVDDTEIADIVRTEDSSCYIIGKKVNWVNITAKVSNKIYTKSVVVRK